LAFNLLERCQKCPKFQLEHRLRGERCKQFFEKRKTFKMNVLIKSPAKRSHFVDPFDRIWKDFSNESSTRHYKPWLTKPAVNLKENEHQFEIQLAIPGFVREDFKIKIEESILDINLEKGKEDQKDHFTKKEFSFAAFHRRFEMGNTIEQEQIKAEYINGILNIILPKKEEAKPPVPRKIEII
jgi:HSP20 family protein